MLRDDLGEKKKCCEKAWILACGLPFVWETLLWSFFRWVALSFRELTYAKNAIVMINWANPSLSLHVCWTGNRQTVYSVQSQNQISELTEAEIWEQIIYIGYCDMKHNAQIDRFSNEIPSKKEEMWCVRALELCLVWWFCMFSRHSIYWYIWLSTFFWIFLNICLFIFTSNYCNY